MMELSQQTMQGLSELIHRLCGLVLGPDKAYLVRHRLAPLLQSEGFASFDQLLERLKSRGGGRLHDAIIEAITTKETSFFRDPAYFEAINKTVLPECLFALQPNTRMRHRIRIWSAGCSTGQEPYSMAMLIRDVLAGDSADDAKKSPFSILATDLSAEALTFAKDGCYTQADVARGLSGAMLARHFHRRGKHWVVHESLQHLVQFRRFDLLGSPAAFGAFDLILCRNVLIYFDESTRRAVCAEFYRALQPGGWLVLGAAESLYGIRHRLESIKLGQAILYRKS
jgi:chemotaxis protein methyltransferase CheR